MTGKDHPKCPFDLDLVKHLELLIRIDERTETNSQSLQRVDERLREQNSTLADHAREIASLTGSNAWTKRILGAVAGVGLLSAIRAFWGRP